MMSKMRFLALVLAYFESAAAQDDGKALVEKACTKCHVLEITTRQRNDKERWSVIVDKMVALGTELTDTEIETIIDYLAKNLGPRVNVNKATADDLANALEITKAAAAAIVKYREKHGSFKSLDDLKKVTAVSAREIESRKDRIEF
jgi:competence protein ComEA